MAMTINYSIKNSKTESVVSSGASFSGDSGEGPYTGSGSLTVSVWQKAFFSRIDDNYESCSWSVTGSPENVVWNSTAFSASYRTEPAFSTPSGTSTIVLWVDPFTITFKGNGGTSSQASAYGAKGDTISLPSATRTGHTFAGWYTAASGGSKVSSPYTVSNSTTLYAHWTVNTYTVTLNKNGGTCSDLTSYTYGVGATLPVATRTGYTFGGWYANSSYTGSPVTAIGTTDTGNKTFFAKWTANVYTVTLHKNDGTGTTSTMSCTYDAISRIPYVGGGLGWSRTGYSFSQSATWSTRADGSGTSYANNGEVLNLTTAAGGNVDLYLIWTANAYTVTLNKNGGTGGSASVTATYDAAMPSATMPTRAHYRFDGYYRNSTQYYTSSGASARTWNVATASTLTANWTIHSYVLTFAGNGKTGGTMATQTVTYGSTVSLPACSYTKTNYRFKGWAESNGGAIAFSDGESVTWSSMTGVGQSKTLYAVWERVPCVVRFDARGGTLNDTLRVVPKGDVITHNTNIFPSYNTGLFQRLSASISLSANLFSVNHVNSSAESQWSHFSPFPLDFISSGDPYKVFLFIESVTSAGADRIKLFETIVPTSGEANQSQLTDADYQRTPAVGTYEYAVSGTTRDATTYPLLNFGRNIVRVRPSSTAAMTFRVAVYAGRAVSGSSAMWKTPYDGYVECTLPIPSKGGYSFSGWWTAASGGEKVTETTAVSSSQTLYARWTANTYTVTLHKNDGTGTTSTMSCTYDASSRIPYVGGGLGWSRTGYSCDQSATWNTRADGSGTSYANNGEVLNLTTAAGGNVDLYLIWTANAYTVTLNKNDGTGTTSTMSCTYDAISRIPYVSGGLGWSRTGYSFSQSATWNTRADGSGTSYANNGEVLNFTTAAGGNVNLYLIWNINSYNLSLTVSSGISKVFYKANGASEWVETAVSKDVMATYGTTWYAYAVAATGYAYDGTSQENPQSGTMGTSGASFAPTATINSYNLTFSLGTGVEKVVYSLGSSAASEVTVTTTISVPFNTQWSAYGVSATGYTIDTPPTGTRTKLAEAETFSFSASVGHYTVELVVNGGAIPAGSDLTSYTYGVGATLPVATRTGYTFGGWYANSSYTGSPVMAIGTTDTGNKTFFAKWTANTYTLTLIERGTQTEKSVTFGQPYGDSVQSPSPATGKTFLGWFTTEETGGVQVLRSSICSTAGNQTLYGRWKDNSYLVVVDRDDGMQTEGQSVSYGASFGLDAPSATGTAFAGWLLLGDSATYSTAKYGTSQESVTTAIPNGETPCFTTPTAKLWFKDLSASDGATVTLKAIWSATQYTATVSAGEGGSGGSSQTYAYSTSERRLAITLPSKPFSTIESWFAIGYAGTAPRIENGTLVIPARTSGNFTIAPVWNTDEENATSFVVSPLSGMMTLGLVMSGVGSCTVDWGDGSGAQSVALSSIKATTEHTYSSSGPFTVTIGPGMKTFSVSEASKPLVTKAKSWGKDVVSVANAYAGCTNLTGSVPEWGESIVNATGVFRNCVGLTGRVPMWTDAVADVSYAFDGCVGLYGPIPPWGAATVKGSGTYRGCTGLTGAMSADVDDLMPQRFSSCTDTVADSSDALRSLFLSAWGGTRPQETGSTVTFSVYADIDENVAETLPPYVTGWGTHEKGASVTLTARDGDDGAWTFSRWSDNGSTDRTRTVLAEADAVFVAEYDGVADRLVYVTNGGVLPAGAAKTYDTRYGLTLPVPTRTGHAFGGWCREPDLSDTPVFALSPGESGVQTLYAKWVAVKYVIRHNSNGGTGTMADRVATYGIPTRLDAIAFVRKGYTFAGWATEPTGAVVYPDRGYVADGAAESGAVCTLYAAWVRNTFAFSIVYHAENGTGVTRTQTVRSTDITSFDANVFTKTGHAFSGWALAAGGQAAYGDAQLIPEGFSA